MEDEWSLEVAAKELEDPDELPADPQEEEPSEPLDAALIARLKVELMTKPTAARTRHASAEHFAPSFTVLPPGVDRAASLHHSRGPSGGSEHLSPGSLASSRSLGSFSLTSEALSEPPPRDGEKKETKSSADSALGESICSKRSSLDRKSACSSVLSGEAWESEASSSSAKPRLPIPSITLPRLPFGRKSSEGASSGGWKLFSKGEAVPSTTGLILQTRPQGVPSKSDEEAAKHQRLYEEMMEAARRREAREAKARRKAAEEQRRAEEALSQQTRLWTSNYLPRWNEAKDSKRCRELWWLGLPPSVRGRVWKLAIGNSLNVTADLYEICANRALERLANPEPESDPGSETTSPGHNRSPSSASFAARLGKEVVNREGTVELVHLDVSRTFATLGIFQKGGPYYDLLLNLLGAYVCYRPDVGYVQGMSFVAAVLLLNMEPAEAFTAFANLLNRPLQLALFRVRQPEMARYFAAFDAYFRQELPALHAHFAALDVAPDLFLIEWMYTAFAKTLPLDVTCRVWDLYLRDGEDFLFKTAIGILTLLQPVLVDADFDGCLQLLSALPSQYSDAEPLFKVIEPLYKKEGSSDRRKFSQILSEIEAQAERGLSGSRSMGSLRSTSPTPSQRSGPPRSRTGLLPDWLRSGERDARD